jgi:hypothetical protein
MITIVAILFPKLFILSFPVYQLRRLFYANTVHSEDVETQKKGQIFIAYTVGQGVGVLDTESTWKLTLLLKACPIRVEAMHFCHDSMSLWFMAMTAIVKLSTTLFTRLRIRTHYGKWGTYSSSLCVWDMGALPYLYCLSTLFLVF